MIHFGKTEIDITIKYTKAIPAAILIILYHLFMAAIVTLDIIALITPLGNETANYLIKTCLYAVILYIILVIGKITLKILQYRNRKNAKRKC